MDMSGLRNYMKLSVLLILLISAPVSLHAQLPNMSFWKASATPKLVFTTAAQNIFSNNCSGIVTVQTKDKNNVVTNVISNLTVNLSSAGSFVFYSDANCLNSISTTIISAGTSSSSFYFNDTTVGSNLFSAASTGYLTANQTQTITSNPYIWIGSGGNSNWTTTANWSGNVVPNSSAIAVFNGTCTSNCSPTINANVNIKGLNTKSSYAGTITQSAGFTIDVGASSWIHNGGNFIGSNSVVTVTGSLIVSGGAFTFPTTTVQVNKDYKILNAAVLTATGSTLTFGCGYGTLCTITPSTALYNNVSFQGSYTGFTLAGATMTVGGNFNAGDTYGASETNQQINNGTFNVTGNVASTYNGYRGNSVIALKGNPAGQTITGGANKFLPSINIDAGTNNVTISGVVTVDYGFSVTSVGTLTTTGSSLNLFCNYGNTCIFYPSTTFYNNLKLTSYYGNWDLGGATLNVSGAMTAGDTYGGEHNQRLNNGTVMAYGDFIISGVGYKGSATVVIAGNASGQTVTGGGADIHTPNLTISAGANPVTFSGIISTTPVFTMNSVGTFTTAGSTLYMSCAHSQTCTMNPGTATYGNVTFRGFYSIFELAGSTLTVAGNLGFGDNYGGRAFNNGTINVEGNITANEAGSVGSALIVAVGNASGQTVSGFTGSTIPNFKSITGANNISLGSNVIVNGTMLISNGVFNMTGYNLNVTSALTISTGATLTRSGGTLTYGSLSNSGTLN